MVPSSVVSTSARSTEPTAEPSGTSEASTVPRGCLAPAARHVQVASPDWLVSSTSMRWAIPGDRLLPPPAGPGKRAQDPGLRRG